MGRGRQVVGTTFINFFNLAKRAPFSRKRAGPACQYIIVYYALASSLVHPALRTCVDLSERAGGTPRAPPRASHSHRYPALVVGDDEPEALEDARMTGVAAFKVS